MPFSHVVCYPPLSSLGLTTSYAASGSRKEYPVRDLMWAPISKMGVTYARCPSSFPVGPLLSFPAALVASRGQGRPLALLGDNPPVLASDDVLRGEAALAREEHLRNHLVEDADGGARALSEDDHLLPSTKGFISSNIRIWLFGEGREFWLRELVAPGS